MGSLDPLDVGDSRRKNWEEFRAAFSAACLQAWVLEELEELAPEYFADLESRFFVGFANADQLAELDPDYDGAVPLESPLEKGAWFISRAEADELYDQLFPHGPRRRPDRSSGYGLVVVGLRSSLEFYARALGVDVRGKLPRQILKFLRLATPPRDLDAWTADMLTECDETRHIVVHNFGIVDEAYRNAVKNNQLQPGERRTISFETTLAFSKAVWRTASALREVASHRDT